MKFNKAEINQSERSNEVRYANCSADKARKLLNYKTSVSLDESLDKLIRFISQRGPKKFEYIYDLEIINDKTPNTWTKKIF